MANIEKKSRAESVKEPFQKDLTFLEESLPSTDFMEYPLELFISFIEHAQMVRNTMPWCKNLSEDFYQEYVLMPRINDEDLVNIRPHFYSELLSRIENLTDGEAVIEVNRWCHEKATYQQADPRTESPRTMYLSGSGRCGEESVFLVTALRSIGIAARQIYTPLWNHCDDNHAWVEAWVDGHWRFLGACEPEPILDRGWFNAAASRAVLIHSRRFSPAPPNEHEQLAGTSGCVYYYNQTSRYANTRKVMFHVVGENLQPIPDATVILYLMNTACFYPITELLTDANGVVNLSLGEGTFLVSIKKGDFYTEFLCDEIGDINKTIQLGCFTKSSEWVSFPIHSAKASAVIPSLDDDLREKRSLIQNEGTLLREKRQEEFFLESQFGAPTGYEDILKYSGGNWKEIVDFISVDEDPIRKSLILSLAPKDYKDITTAILNDHLQARQFDGKYAEDIFVKYLLSPRIEWERITPWRGFFLSAISQENQLKWGSEPNRLWDELHQTISPLSSQHYSKLILSPEKCWKYQQADERSLRVLFVAILRTIGVPSRLRESDGIPEYFKNGCFIPAILNETGTLLISNFKSESPLVYDQNWSLSSFSKGLYSHQNFSTSPEKIDEIEKYTLPIGDYRVTLSTRLPNGNQECKLYDFSLKSFENIELSPLLPTFNLSEILANYPLPDYSACHFPDEKQVENPNLQYPCWNLLCWIEEGAEPTEHVLNELLENQETIQTLPLKIHFFVKEILSLEQVTLKKVLNSFPNISVYTENWLYNLDNMSRATYGNADTPPLLILCNENGEGVYSTSGYNVGTIPLISQIVELDDK